MDAKWCLSIIVLFDFGAAFPSIVQHWFCRVFRAVGIPEGAIHVSWSMYWTVMGFGRTDCAVTVSLFLIRSGVLQGCPFVGSYFVLALDPFLQAFDADVVKTGKGVIGVCADDIGASLTSISLLGDYGPRDF